MKNITSKTDIFDNYLGRFILSIFAFVIPIVTAISCYHYFDWIGVLIGSLVIIFSYVRLHIEVDYRKAHMSFIRPIKKYVSLKQRHDFSTALIFGGFISAITLLLSFSFAVIGAF